MDNHRKHSTSSKTATATEEPASSASSSKSFSSRTALLLCLKNWFMNRSSRRPDHTRQFAISTTQGHNIQQCSGPCLCTNCKCGTQISTTSTLPNNPAIQVHPTAADSNHTAQPIRKESQPDDAIVAIVSEPLGDSQTAATKHVTQTNASQATRARPMEPDTRSNTRSNSVASKNNKKRHISWFQKLMQPKPRQHQTRSEQHIMARLNMIEERNGIANDERMSITHRRRGA